MARDKITRLPSGWLVGGERTYSDPEPEAKHVPEPVDPLGRLRFVSVPPPPGRFDAPAAFTALHVESNGKVYFVTRLGYWAGGAWHSPRWESPIIYSGPSSTTVRWGYVDGPRVLLPYSTIVENGAIKLIDVQADVDSARITPYLRYHEGVYTTSMVPSQATSWHDGVPLNYDSGVFVVPFISLLNMMGRSVRLKIQKYNPVTKTTYMHTVTLVEEGDISFSTQPIPLAKYGIKPDGTVDLSSAEQIGTIDLPVATFSGSFISSYSDETESELYKQSFTAYPGFRYAYIGGYSADGDYYRMPDGYTFVEFGVLVRWGKIYDYATGDTINATYSYYRLIDEGVDITYPSGYVDEDIFVAHEPFLSFVPLSLVDGGSAYEATIAPTTTPLMEGQFSGTYLFPIWGAMPFIMMPAPSPYSSDAWPHYFSCPTGCALPLSSHPIGKSIAGVKVRRIIARRQGESATYYKEIPYGFPTFSSGVYLDGMRYGPDQGRDDLFVVVAFAPLSSGRAFSCVLPPLSPHPHSSLHDYVTWARAESANALPPLLDMRPINVALGHVPIYDGVLGTIPRPLSGQTGRFMGVDINASAPFALAAVRMPSDPDKVWGLLIQGGLVRVWLWDGTVLGGWTNHPLSPDGTLDIPLVDWLVAPNVASVALDDSYDPYRSLGGGSHANELARLLGKSPPSLDLEPVMLGNYLLPGWPFEVDYVGFDYQYQAYQNGAPPSMYAPSLSYAFLEGVDPQLLLVHVAFVDLESQGAMPGAQVRVPVVPIFATLVRGDT